MSVLIVGSVAFDSIATPFGEVDRVLGGSATYASLATSYFTSPKLVAIVGKDFTNRHIQVLKQRGIDVQGLEKVKGGLTFHWRGYYEGDMSQAHTLSTCVNVFEGFRPRLPRKYRQSRFVFLANIDPELQLEVIEQINNPGLVMCDTMNFWIEGKRDKVLQVFKQVDIVLLNDAEARLLFGTTNLQQAAQELLKLGPSRVIIKKGEHGILMFSQEGIFALPAYPLEVVRDPTGAGDTFAGGLIGWLSRYQRPNQSQFKGAAVIGTIMASFVVEDFGPKKLMHLSKQMVEERAAKLRQLCYCPRIKV